MLNLAAFQTTPNETRPRMGLGTGDPALKPERPKRQRRNRLSSASTAESVIIRGIDDIICALDVLRQIDVPCRGALPQSFLFTETVMETKTLRSM